MAKKKTKTKASWLAAEAFAAVNATKELVNSNDEPLTVETSNNRNECSSFNRMSTVDFLSAHLKSTVGKSSLLHMQPRVILTAEDALRLNVRVEDCVILASMSDICDVDSNPTNVVMKKRIKALSVLPIEIYNDRQTVSDSGVSPALHRKNVSQQWLPGTIQFTSSSLLDIFDSDSLSEPFIRQSKEDDTEAIIQSPTTPTSTSFSFKSVVQTPRSSNSQTRESSSTKGGTNGRFNKMRRMIHVINCQSKLGQYLLQALSLKCSKLIVEPIDATSKPIELNELYQTGQSLRANSSSSSVRVLERLIHAHIVGSYVQLGQILCVSFAGKPYHVRIVNVLHNDAKSTGVITDTTGNIGYQFEDHFSKLNIRDGVNDTNIGGAMDSEDAQLLVDTLLKCGIKLYHVCRLTQVSINIKYRDRVKAIACDDESSQVNVVLPVPPKQYVAGLSLTLQEVRSLLLLPLTQPDFFTKRRMKPPRGMLLYGPSGVGKTCVAKQLLNEICAENDKWNCDVRYIHCALLQSKSIVVGEAESELTRLFHPVDQKSILIILDDVHLIGGRRGRGSSGTDRLAATLLALMDGIQSNSDGGCVTEIGAKSAKTAESIFILAITTNPSLLDPALRRPGRLDNEVEVPLPEETTSRAEIFQFHVNQFEVRLADNLFGQSVWLEVAKLAKGFNGADCMLAVKEAVRLAMMESPDSDVTLRQEHLKAAIRSIKPSAIKSITVEIPQVLWSSIGGMDSVKRELREAIELPLTHSEYFQHLKIPPPRGILLYGPPGCSKTLMARALATEGNMNFLAVKGPELLSKWLGESERALSSLFRRARMASPAIIFFDEIDAIASNRGSGDSASSGRLLSQLLTELDGINHTGSAATCNSKKQHRVVVVGATNRPDLLDTALTRPGRIDRMIYVGPPDAASRAQILQLSLQNVACGKDIDISTLASDAYSAGFSGAEMVAICRDAALLSLEEVSDGQSRSSPASGNSDRDVMPVIEMRHLLSAMQQMQRQITPEMVEFYSSYRESYYCRR